MINAAVQCSGSISYFKYPTTREEIRLEREELQSCVGGNEAASVAAPVRMDLQCRVKTGTPLNRQIEGVATFWPTKLSPVVLWPSLFGADKIDIDWICCTMP